MEGIAYIPILYSKWLITVLNDHTIKNDPLTRKTTVDETIL